MIMTFCDFRKGEFMTAVTSQNIKECNIHNTNVCLFSE